MTQLYEQAYTILEPYLAKATKRFLDRQIASHLSKAPEELEYDDKEELAKWIRISSGLILGKRKAMKLYDQIMELQP